jgi:Tfp pilus assembly protein PilE
MKKYIFKHMLGQTLIEVMLTLLILGVTAVSLISFQNYLAYSNSLSRQTSEALLIATNKMETLKDFQVLNNLTGYTSYQSIATGTSTTTGNSATYNLSWTVTAFTNPTYKNVNLTVSWTDRNNVSQSVNLTARIAGIDPSLSASAIGG